MLNDIQHYLSHLNLGPISYFETIGSTNDLAAERLAKGAPDLSIIISDEQTTGRGRHGRSWHTPPGAALAFSVILHTPHDSPPWVYAPLGALAVHDALSDFDLNLSIKWPNDILINRKKVCGILAEANWQGLRLQGVVLGIGVNVNPEAIPRGDVPFPATSISSETGSPVNRWGVLARILEELITWRSRIGEQAFIKGWEERLAFKGERVMIGEEQGILTGLTNEGSIRLQTTRGEKNFPTGELSLRPARQ
jgi:BirA family biotin operon repressor/biotin-[acetyl-CoA-carboxylase] ligase